MNNYTIKELLEENFEPFYSLMAEIEIGDLYNPDNENHIKWLQNKIKMRYGAGTVFFAIYEENNLPVGLMGVQVELPLDGVPYLGQKSEFMDIVVDEQYRNMGYGKALLKYAEKYAKDKGAYCMYAATAAFDYETVLFYGKNDFVPIATLVDVNGPNEDGLLYMRKIL